MDLRACRARRDAVHSGRGADPLRPFSTARLGIHKGSHQGLTGRASKGKGVAGGCVSRPLTAAGAARPGKARTKPAARLEALERERLARQRREGLVPSDDNRRRTFGELMSLWQERYGSRLRSQTIKLSVEKHLRPALGKLMLGGAAAALPALLNSKIGDLSPSSLNHLRAYCHRLYTVASMRSVGWWMGPNPVNRLELPKFKEPRRKRPTVAAEDVPRVLAALSPEWRPLFATAFFLGLRRGELVALQKEDIDLREWTITVRRSGESDVTKGGDDGTVPIPEPLRPYIDAAINLSPSKWVFPAADGSQRAPDTNLKAVLRRALGRAGIVDGYEHRCRKPGCGHVERADDSANRRCPKDNRALWIRPLPRKGIVFHSLRQFRFPDSAPTISSDSSFVSEHGCSCAT